MMWAVMKVQDFEVEQNRFPFKVELDFAPMIGYIPVYDSIDDAKKDYPDGPFAEIREVAK